jgi:hypothetical protein
MEYLGLIGFGVGFIKVGRLLVRYLKRIQHTSDRRYPESTDDGAKVCGGY